MAISWKERLLEATGQTLTEKQTSIIIAAVELFGEQGYADTSTRQIAQAAGVSEGSIFKLFPTKKALLLYISQQIFKHVVPSLLNYGLPQLFEQEHDNLEDFLRQFLSNRLEILDNNIIMVKVILQEAMFRPEIRASFIAAFVEAMNQSHILWGIRLLKGGGLMADKPEQELVSMFLTGFMGYVFTRYIVLPEMFPVDKEQDREQFVLFMARALGA